MNDTGAREPLSSGSVVLRFAVVALAAVAGAFAYLGGWLTPGDLTPARFVHAFEQANGVHAGFRRNHAKGPGVSGFFDSNEDGVRLSRAVVFRPRRVRVLGRFSLSGGMPHVADSADAVRGLGLQFSLPDGEAWRTAMINLPVFPFRTPEAFYEQLVASRPDRTTGKPDPDAMKAFLERHPETAQALGVIKGQPPASGFENTTFYGLNAFRFINSSGESTPFRWLLTPRQPFETAGEAPATRDPNYLFDALIAHIRRVPLRWQLVVVIGQSPDPTHDATIAWPADRERVVVGTLTVDRADAEETSAATDLNFDPLGASGGHRAIGRSPAERAVGRVRALVHQA